MTKLFMKTPRLIFIGTFIRSANPFALGVKRKLSRKFYLANRTLLSMFTDSPARLRKIFTIICCLFSLSFTLRATAYDFARSIDLQTGLVWQNRNDVQIPGDTGTRFSLDDIIGSSALSFYRLEFAYEIETRHSLRFLLAPFEYTESGKLDKEVFFVDQSFESNKPTEATYRFNSYRATYRYLFHNSAEWSWRIGFTAKIRDAEITLKQNGKSASETNVGFVPLVNLYGEYQLRPGWSFIFDFDGLVGPQGRAFDLGVMAHVDIAKQWYIGGGYRTLEGGADNDDVYNFTWLNYVFLSAGYRF